MPSTPLPNTPNANRIALQGTLGPHNWACILHNQWSGSNPSTSSQNAFASQIGTAWGAHMASLFLSNVVLATVDVVDLTSSVGAGGSAAPASAGSASGNEIAASAAILINYPSSFRYRGGHPRTYLPPGSQADLTNSATWSSTFVTAVTTAWGAFIAAALPLNYAGTIYGGQCAVSYVSASYNPTPPHYRSNGLIMPISSFTVEAEVASQRRRIGRK